MSLGMIKTRLITALGPSQLLNAISILRYQQSFEGLKNYRDILLLGGLCLDKNDPNSQKLFDICIEISQIWNFHACYTSTKIEDHFKGNSGNLTATSNFLKEYLDLPFVDIVYTVRNWQFFNEVVLVSYSSAHKICYGDSYACLDLNSTYIEKPINPEGFIQMDEAYLIQPGGECTKDIFDTIPIKFIDFQLHKSTLEQAAQTISGFKAYCKKLQDSPTLPSFILTSNNTEAGFTSSIKAEINLYLASILPYAEKDETFLIKAHPRQTLNQSHLLAESIVKSGFAASVITRYQQVPIDLFSIFIPIKKAFSLSSSSCIPLAYLNQCQLIIGFGELATYRYIDPRYQEISLAWEPIFVRLAQQAYLRRFKPVRYSEIEQEISTIRNRDSSIQFHQYPARITSDQPGKILGFKHPDAELLLIKIDREQLKTDLVLTQQTLTEIQCIFKSSEEELSRLKNEFKTLQTDINLMESQLNLTKSQLELTKSQLDHTRSELDTAQQQIEAMQSTKFWKLRILWIKIKTLLFSSRMNCS